MGTQKNGLNEMVLLSFKTCVKIDGLENNDNFTLKKCPYLDLRLSEKMYESVHKIFHAD